MLPQEWTDVFEEVVTLQWCGLVSNAVLRARSEAARLVQPQDFDTSLPFVVSHDAQMRHPHVAHSGDSEPGKCTEHVLAFVRTTIADLQRHSSWSDGVVKQQSHGLSFARDYL